MREEMNETIQGAYAGCRAMITGGAGFIGSNLTRQLVNLGAEVLVVDSLIPEYGGNLFNLKDQESLVRVNISDVRDEFSMSYLVQGQQYLFNLAGQTSHLDSMRDPFADLEINCRAQLSILEACRKYNPDIRVVFASTRQIYGVPDYLPVDERHPLHPTDVNGINKMAGECFHSVYGKVYGIRSCALRLTNTYGPRMRIKDARQTFLGWWIHRILKGDTIEVYGDGSQLRDFTYVDDVVEALLLVGSSEKAFGNIYNLGGEEHISLKALAELLVELNGSGDYRVIPFPPERKAIDIGDYYSDFGKIRTELGWRPGVPLQEGLMRTLAYFRSHHDQYR